MRRLLVAKTLGFTALATIMAASPLYAQNDIPQAAGNDIYDRDGTPMEDELYTDEDDNELYDNEEVREERQDAQELVNDAVVTVQKMKADEGMIELLRQAKGVYIVPDYGRGALIAGVRGGQGVMLARKDGGWSHPAFYNIGAISIGAQAGIEAGEVAFLLMSDRAVNGFKQENNFSLNADAGLTIIDWSAQAQASLGKGDVILWSDTEGALVSGAISASDIMVDDEANRAYYSPTADARAILGNQVVNAPEKKLDRVLP